LQLEQMQIMIMKNFLKNYQYYLYQNVSDNFLIDVNLSVGECVYVV
jgi:hypothetical protein